MDDTIINRYFTALKKITAPSSELLFKLAIVPISKATKLRQNHSLQNFNFRD